MQRSNASLSIKGTLPRSLPYLHPLAMWRLCAAVLVLQLPISEGKSDEPKYDYSYDEPEYDEDGMIVRGPFGNAEYDIDLGPGATAAMYLD